LTQGTIRVASEPQRSWLAPLLLLVWLRPAAMTGAQRFVVVGGGVCGVTCCQTLSASLAQHGGEPNNAKVGRHYRLSLVSSAISRGNVRQSAGNADRGTRAAQGRSKRQAPIAESQHLRHCRAGQCVGAGTRHPSRCGSAWVIRYRVQAFDEISGPNTDVLEGEAVRVNSDRKEVLLADGRAVPYDKLCICTGARPRQVSRPPHHPRSMAKRFSNPSCAPDLEHDTQVLDHPHVLTLRDTESASELRQRLKSARRIGERARVTLAVAPRPI
jgi:hypothetical protein